MSVTEPTTTTQSDQSDEESPFPIERRTLSVAEFLALPEDDTLRRHLIDGELWEEDAVNRRNRFHGFTTAQLGTELVLWMRTQTSQSLEAYTGDVGFILPTEPETVVGIDIALVSSETVDSGADDPKMIRGIPTLAVEVVSGGTRVEDLTAKARLYQSVGVPQYWEVNPYIKTVTVFRPKGDPTFFAAHDTLTGDPELPGLSIPVSGLFRD